MALIQVLLICSMLLILTVQLSKESKEQVNTSLMLKRKAEGITQLYSLNEQVKYALLTQQKSSHIQIENVNVGLFGEHKLLGNGLFVEIQDEFGLISLPYDEEALKAWLEGDISLLEQIKDWQGTNHNASSGIGRRNGLMPVLHEVNMITGNKVKDTEGLTHLPTNFFSVGTAPETVINKILGARAEELLNARNSQPLTEYDVSSILGGGAGFSDSALGGDIIRVDTGIQMEKQLQLIRGRKYRLNPTGQDALVEIGS